MAIKSLKLSSTDIENLIKGLENARKEINNFKDYLPHDIAKLGLDYLNSLYASTPLDENIEDITTSIKKTTSGYSIISRGKDVLYEEFGTGDKGKANPHPEKGKYNLKEYNSGSTIRDVPDISTMSTKQLDLFAKYNITTGKYWAYVKNGRTILTQGVPSGKQMFNTRNYLRKNMKSILDEKASDVLSKV